MPIYEFKCEKCSKSIEVMQKVSDAEPAECGDCGGSMVKVFHPVGLIFKGSGFYTTDYNGAKKSSVSGNGDKKEDKPAACEGCDKACSAE